jgi:hypothetical protein
LSRLTRPIAVVFDPYFKVTVATAVLKLEFASKKARAAPFNTKVTFFLVLGAWLIPTLAMSIFRVLLNDECCQRPVRATATVAVPRQVAAAHVKVTNRPLEFGVILTEPVVTRSVPLPSAKVTVVAGELALKYVDSAALVAVTTQVPALEAESELPLTAQPLAVPLVTVYVSAPEPEPPLVASESDVPTFPVTLVSVNALCAVPTDRVKVQVPESPETSESVPETV